MDKYHHQRKESPNNSYSNTVCWQQHILRAPYITFSLQDILLQHVKRITCQRGVWNTILEANQQMPLPDIWGWTKEGSSWKPQWMTLPEAARVSSRLVKCACRSTSSAYHTANMPKIVLIAQTSTHVDVN